ncbi:hypothetical protein BTBSAS_10132 [Brochothrix thermosphacta]|uniref:Uncharacterized protein n=1 Tax=Brochothrix thermosphacta TaxID=2756 RepID=A0A2X0QCR9_BROTH|nr:hypothetical protein BTBSAS_10132 [Brochothrix thermosphacta]
MRTALLPLNDYVNRFTLPHLRKTYPLIDTLEWQQPKLTSCTPCLLIHVVLKRIDQANYGLVYFEYIIECRM